MKVTLCNDCGEYTLSETCPLCNKKTVSVKPAKFSPDDRLGRWRRIFKKNK